MKLISLLGTLLIAVTGGTVLPTLAQTGGTILTAQVQTTDRVVLDAKANKIPSGGIINKYIRRKVIQLTFDGTVICSNIISNDQVRFRNLTQSQKIDALALNKNIK